MQSFTVSIMTRFVNTKISLRILQGGVESVYQLSDCQLLKKTLFHRIRYWSRLFADDAEYSRTRLSALFNHIKQTGN